ncbi:hypothetical protein ACLOJK_032193 [Asimina triloba]
MGKPKLKSSIKALFGFGQPGSKTMTWVCIQQTKTHSFREVYKSFNSMYYSSSSAASTSTDLCCVNDDTERPEAARVLSTSSSLPSAAEESFSACSSSSSCLSTEPDAIFPAAADDDDSILRNYISSKRFFFSPCTTKSIMGEETTAAEAQDDLGVAKIGFSGDRWTETGEDREDDEGEEEGAEEGRGECMVLEMGFCRESVTMALASLNPYMDFRVSMAEMVEAHGLREWSCLQKLLHCYLRLNDKRTHKIIVLAFVDLLMNLIAGETNADHDSSSSSFNKEKRLPPPLRNLLKDETSIITTTNNSPHKEGKTAEGWERWMEWLVGKDLPLFPCNRFDPINCIAPSDLLTSLSSLPQPFFFSSGENSKSRICSGPFGSHDGEIIDGDEIRHGGQVGSHVWSVIQAVGARGRDATSACKSTRLINKTPLVDS